ncbi:TonB-dependent receptor [Sulfuricurvum sp.]|uniref:TonB-dependent receptor n=1 Tax=Sulfuricurvum sp. TaxID=2025608 RepID=UPI0026210233|nr:TonB-dependent receptor [Sulfuricurvum sp.]MDD2267753.1 TonB-dependent receptor [Sulfuricurvum sp.]MDD2783705.1 TonB-dependent receptor [Sulfuricurvum sp.]
MSKPRRISHSILLSTLLVTASFATENLGIIGIDSTTIDDRFTSKQTEVSNTATISGETVDEAHIENIQQVLNRIPGITTEVTGGDKFKLHIRGVENQRYMGEKPGVAVVIDGVPVFERTGSVNIDLDNIESIKVVKGGASYLFGEDALSGAVIITTKKGAKNSYSAVGVEAGSFDYRKYLLRGGYATDTYNFYVQGSQRTSDSFWENGGYDNKYLNSKFQYYIDDTSDITAGIELSDRNKDSHGTVKGVTEAETNPTSAYNGTGDRDYARKFDVQLAKYFLTYAKTINDSSNLLVNVYQYNDNTNFISGPIKYDTSGAKVTADDAYGTNNDYFQIQRGIKSELRTSGETFATMLGLDLRDNYYENKTNILQSYCTRMGATACSNPNNIKTAGTITGNDETDENVYALYGELKYALSNDLVMTGNARYDRITMDYDDTLNSIQIKKTFNVGSYRLGTTYALTPSSSLYANVSTGFRTPTVSQLFAGDIDPTNTKVESNHALKPETSYNYEIGLRGNTSWFDYDMAVFMIDRKDYIMANVGQYASTDPANPLYTATQYDNIGGMRNKGFELSLNTDRKETFFFDVAYSFIDAKFTQYDNFNLTLGNSYGTYVSTLTNPASQYTIEHYNLTGNVVPRVPKHTLNLSVGYNYNEHLLLTTELNAKSNYYADELNRIEIAGQATLNLLANYTAKIYGYRFEAFARIDNVLDKFYYNTARASGDANSDGIFDAEDLSITVNPGRVYTAGLSVKF